MSKRPSSDHPPPAGHGPRGSTPGDGRRRSWFATHRRDLGFLGIFVLVLLVYWGCTTIPWVEQEFFPWYLRLNAAGATKLLNGLGYDEVTTQGQAMMSPRFSMQIERGCDAVDPSALFIAAVLASPVVWWRRIAAAAVGTGILLALNFVRLVTLYMTGLYLRKLFDMMHLNVWQAGFIIVALLLWAVWAARVTRRPKAQRDVPH